MEIAEGWNKIRKKVRRICLNEDCGTVARFIGLSRDAISLENSIYFANLEPNVGRTRDEINLRSFLGIKSGVSAKFGSQPADLSAAKYTYEPVHLYYRTVSTAL